MFSKEQNMAVCCDKSVLCVLAGPGSGKTKVISGRIAYLFEKNDIVSGSNDTNDSILALSFSNKSAKEITRRSKYVAACTIHSFARRVLLDNVSSVPNVSAGFSVVDETGKMGILRRCVEKCQSSHSSEISIGDCIRFIKSKKGVCKNRVASTKSLDCVYAAYQDVLRKKNALDFDDLLVECANLFRKKHVLQETASKLRVVLIDEFQDVDKFQFECIIVPLIRAVLHSSGASGSSTYVTVVGDEDQSIYGFRGAFSGIFVSFRSMFSPEVIVLPHNYRSGVKIINVCKTLIQNNNMRHPKTQLAVRVNEGVVKFYQCESVSLEIESVAQLIIEKGKEFGYGSIAVLCRQEKDVLEEFRKECTAKKIPVQDECLFEKSLALVCDIGLYVISKCSDGEAISRVLRSMLKFSFKNYVVSVKNELKDAGKGAGFQLYRAILGIINNNFKESFGYRPTQTDERALRQLFTLLKQSHYLFESKKEVSTKINEYITLCAEYLRLKHFKEKIEEVFVEIGKGSLSFRFKNARRFEHRSGVTLCTIHKSKGLEWKVVFLVRMNKGICPSKGSKDMEEERRIAFVGCSRAEDELHVSFIENESFVASLFIKEMNQGEEVVTVDGRVDVEKSIKEKEKRLKDRRSMIDGRYMNKIGPVDEINDDITGNKRLRGDRRHFKSIADIKKKRRKFDVYSV